MERGYLEKCGPFNKGLDRGRSVKRWRCTERKECKLETGCTEKERTELTGMYKERKQHRENCTKL